MFRTLPALAMVAALTIPQVFAQSTPQVLTDQQIATAIEIGKNARLEDIGLTVKPGRLGGFLRGIAATAANPAAVVDGNNGLAIAVFTPKAWITYKAALEKRDFGTLEVAKVPADWRRPVVRVFVRATGMATTAILRNASGAAFKQNSTTQCPEPIHFGRELTRECMAFEFPLEEVRTVANDEFIITVRLVGQSVVFEGQGGEAQQDVKVERKNLNKLPM